MREIEQLDRALSGYGYGRTAKRRKPPTKKKSLPRSSSRSPNEATTWLERNQNPYPFASNTFTRASALRYVVGLYRAGASLVKVAEVFGEPWRMQQEGGPYAATFVVSVPSSKERSVLAYVSKGRNKPDEVRKRKGGLRLWWD